MDTKINSEFSGTINGIKFNNENAFYCVCNILYTMEEVKNISIVSSKIVKVIQDAYSTCVIHGGSTDEFEEICVRHIQNGQKNIFPRSKTGIYVKFNKCLETV